MNKDSESEVVAKRKNSWLVVRNLDRGVGAWTMSRSQRMRDDNWEGSGIRLLFLICTAISINGHMQHNAGHITPSFGLPSHHFISVCIYQIRGLPFIDLCGVGACRGLPRHPVRLHSCSRSTFLFCFVLS